MKISPACLIVLGFSLLNAALASAQDQPARSLWGRFETPADLAAWTTSSTTFEMSTRFATEGAHSARIHFKKYTGAPGEQEWPLVTTAKLFPPDWSRWGAIALDLSNGSKESERISIEIRDNADKNGWVITHVLPPETTVNIVIPLVQPEGATKIDMKHIVTFIIFKGHPPRDADIYVDNIRLLHPEVNDLETALGKAASALGLLWTGQANAASQHRSLRELKAAAASPTLTLAQARLMTARAEELTRDIDALRLAPLRAFDFGPAGSPVRPGFTAVTAKSIYSPAAGFGWRDAAGVKGASTPAQRKWVDSAYMGRKVPPAVYFNDLTQDLVGGEAPAEFVVNIPPGDYTVWILAGFPRDHEPIVNDFVVNAGAGDVRVSLPQYHIFESRFIPATAGRDGLVLGFKPETGFVINALAIFPAADEGRARKEFAGPIDQEVFLLPPDLWAQWRLLPHAAEKPAPPPSDEERQRGYVLFSRPYVQNVYPDSQPQRSERFEKLQAFATPDEFEPITFEVQALHDLENLGVTLPDGLAGPAGARIGPLALELRQVRSWAVRTDYSVMGTYKVVPEILDPAAPARLAAGVCRRYWLTVHVPADAEPGIYEGSLIVKAANAPPATVPVALEVLPFRLLRDPTKSFGVYYDSPLDKITPGLSPAVVAAIQRRAEAEARDMRDHGMTTLQMGGISAKQVNGQWEAVINMDERIAFYRQFGLWGKAPGVMMSLFFAEDIAKSFTGKRWNKHLLGADMPPQGYFDSITRIVGQIERHRIERGWPEFYYYPIDEASPEGIPLLAATLAAIKKVPTAKTYATQVFERPANRPLDDVLDVWSSSEFCTDLASVDAMRRKGRIFWCYPNFTACSRGVPNSARMTYGFGLWRMGYSCLIPWHYQNASSSSNPFCDFDGVYGDWCMAYPGPGGVPIPTQRWEALREGIDDGRYLYTLESRVADARKRRNENPAVAAAEALLNEIRAAIPVRATYDQDGPWTGAEYASYRRRIADAIIAME